MNKISVIIPIFNEVEHVAKLIQHLNNSSYRNKNIEIIVVDGGSTDDSKQMVSGFKNVLLVESDKGRAKQMNFGAKHATGNILYFLHVDSFPPNNYYELIINEVRNNNKAGCFRMKFDEDYYILKISQWFTRFNYKICRGGDQSLFVTKDVFETLKGYDETYTVYEDCEFINRLYDHYDFTVIPDYITTSTRRYNKNGAIKLQYHFAIIHLKKIFGAPANELYNYYKKNIA